MEQSCNKHSYAAPEMVLDGSDMNQDIHQLMGYVWAEGNEKRVMPSEHFAHLGRVFLQKYVHVVKSNPKPTEEDSGEDLLG